MTSPQVTSAPWHLAVLIPARDEERLIGRCLHSVLEARQAILPYATCDIVVVSDSSADTTHAIAQHMLPEVSGVTVLTSARCVGAARALAAQVALERYTGLPETCWLANTDADCVVPADWLLRHLALARQGWSAVAGIIDVDSFEDHDANVPERFRTTYLTHRDGSHPHVHGANLGVRADAYLRAGGWAALYTAEDHDLWARLQQGHHACLADASLSVLTSGRRVGRAPLGFAQALALHNGTTS